MCASNKVKSFAITDETTATDLCEMFAKKMLLSGRHFDLIEFVEGKGRRVDSSEKVLLLQQKLQLNPSPFGHSKDNGFLCTFR